MESHHPDQELIRQRMEAYAAASQRGSVDEVMSFMADNASISDFGAGIDNLNNAAFRSFLAKVFEASGNMNITTRSISGHKNFTAWEYDVTFNYDKPLDEVNRKAVLGLEVADGRLAHMVSVSLFWWNDDGKIVKAHNYSMAVAN